MGTFGLIIYTYPYLGLAFIPILVFFVSAHLTGWSVADNAVVVCILLPHYFQRAQKAGLDFEISCLQHNWRNGGFSVPILPFGLLRLSACWQSGDHCFCKTVGLPTETSRCY